MNEIVKVFNDRPVRIVEQDGAPWFVAADACRVLGLGNGRSSLALLDEDEKGVHSMDTPGGEQEMAVVNESGLYSLILRSRKPEAKTFKRWITHDVIPSIRNTGGYGGNAELNTERLIAAIERQAEENARLRTENGLLRLFQPIGQPGDVSNRTGREKWKFRRGCFVSGKNGRSTSVFLIVQPELPLFLERQIARREG